MKVRRILTTAAAVAVATLLCAGGAWAQAANDTFAVVPFEFDPGNLGHVSGKWIHGLGVPSDAIAPVDANDPKNDGLLLGKSEPTSDFAASGAKLVGLQNNLILSEIGWDVRDGSHCGAGAPRFNVTTTDGDVHFIGCNSPAPISTTVPAPGWQRFRYDPAAAFPPIASPVSSISIVFDEGTDQGTGYAIIDNIDVNGTAVGH